MKSPIPNSYWLEPGRIACGEYPLDVDEFEDEEVMDRILGAGVRVFLNLTQEGELPPYEEVARAVASKKKIDPASLQFHRFAVRDGETPSSRDDLRQLCRIVRMARLRHAGVYIHCYGGRGRTGTVAGCLLRELFGVSGKEALRLLTKRWKACAKSVYSESPETDAQRRFIESFEPFGLSGGELVTTVVLGAAVGDALGVPVEFQGRVARKEDPVTGMREYGTHHQPAGTWSDDTSLILATMAGFVGAQDYDPEAIIVEFAHWVRDARHTPHGEVFDIGNATSLAIDRYVGGTPAIECGGRRVSDNGNGSLMRILPVALAYRDAPSLLGKASEISCLTHAHERSRWCCAMYCLAVSDLSHGSSLREAADFAWTVMNERWRYSETERTLFEELDPRKHLARPEVEIGSSGHVLDTLGAALWVNDRHESYRDAVLRAVNLGDDTDTTGCVAGGLAALVHGRASIPEEWLRVLVKREEIEDQCRAFGEYCQGAARGEAAIPQPEA